MNRIILIGNGFDLAHGMKTSYKDFVSVFWEKEKEKVLYKLENWNTMHVFKYIDDYIEFSGTGETINSLIQKLKAYKNIDWFDLYSPYIKSVSLNENHSPYIKVKNNFLYEISKKTNLQNWIDIEEEYYSVLKKYYKTIENVKNLHLEFQEIQDLLKVYLNEQIDKIPKRIANIEKHFYSKFSQDDFISTLNPNEDIHKLLFLNFNYTPTVKLYNYGIQLDNELNHIHGELKNPDNPIIFGYGNERDDEYKLIEKENNNELLSFIKSFMYSKTTNYRNVTKFINETDFQILIFGLSCGLSDSTLLKSIFEHKNCRSIKIFYYLNSEGKDNYDDTYMNISRHFTDKEKMREIIVPKELCIAYC